MSVCKLAPVVCVHEKNERSRGNEQTHPYFASERIRCLLPKRQLFIRVESLDHDTYICEANWGEVEHQKWRTDLQLWWSYVSTLVQQIQLMAHIIWWFALHKNWNRTLRLRPAPSREPLYQWRSNCTGSRSVQKWIKDGYVLTHWTQAHNSDSSDDNVC